MKKIIPKIKKSFLIIASLGLLILPLKFILASTITPSVIDFRSKPGETKAFLIKIKNDEQQIVCFKLDPVSISNMADNGTPVFDSVQTEVAAWVRLADSKVCVKSNETITTTITVAIPADTTRTSLFVAAYFTPTAAGNVARGSAVINRVGVLLAGRIDGANTQEQGRVTQFAYDQINKKFIVDFLNDGNVHLRPYGEIDIKNNSGAILETLSFNEIGSLVLPNSSRHFEIPLTKHIYEPVTAVLQVFYGTGPKSTNAMIEIKFASPEDNQQSKWSIIFGLIVGAILIRFVVKKMRKNSSYV